MPPSEELSRRLAKQRRSSWCSLSGSLRSPIDRLGRLRGSIQILLSSTSACLFCPWRPRWWNGPRAVALADCPLRLAHTLTVGGLHFGTRTCVDMGGSLQDLGRDRLRALPSSLPPEGEGGVPSSLLEVVEKTWRQGLESSESASGRPPKLGLSLEGVKDKYGSAAAEKSSTL